MPVPTFEYYGYFNTFNRFSPIKQILASQLPSCSFKITNCIIKPELIIFKYRQKPCVNCDEQLTYQSDFIQLCGFVLECFFDILFILHAWKIIHTQQEMGMHLRNITSHAKLFQQLITRAQQNARLCRYWALPWNFTESRNSWNSKVLIAGKIFYRSGFCWTLLMASATCPKQ